MWWYAHDAELIPNTPLTQSFAATVYMYCCPGLFTAILDGSDLRSQACTGLRSLHQCPAISYSTTCSHERLCQAAQCTETEGFIFTSRIVDFKSSWRSSIASAARCYLQADSLDGQPRTFRESIFAWSQPLSFRQSICCSLVLPANGYEDGVACLHLSVLSNLPA